VDIRCGGVSGYRVQEERTALATIRQEPTPEVETFPGSPDGSASTAKKGEVKKDNGVRCTKPNVNDIRRPEVTVDDPLLSLHKVLLDRHPLISGHRDKTTLPEDFVQFNDRKSCDGGQLDRKS
jgi:hypothetical protein